jgi:DNA-binding CsgD family transcriptional regulator
MDGYDPSLLGTVKRKLSFALQAVRQILAVLTHSGNHLDPNEVLTAREKEIFRLYGMNRTPWEIAVRFFISTQSANTQLNVISRKLRIRRSDLQRVAREFVREPQPQASSF